jgi:hypothetical protein
MPSGKRFVLGVAPTLVLAALATLMAASPASATILSASTSVASCTNSHGQTVNGCTDTIYYSSSTASDTTPFLTGSIDGVNPITADFDTAFTDWNAANGNKWTLVDGGVLNLTITLSIAPSASTNSGGITPVIANISNYTPGYNDPTLGQLAWTQALFTDYTPTAGPTRTPDVTLDTYALSAGSAGSGGAFQTACTAIPSAPNPDDNTTPSTIGAVPSGTAFCDPIYPFQYGSSDNGASANGVLLGTDFFYDGPQGPWTTGAFRGISLLSTVTYDTNAQGTVTGDILTVYQGIDYGFTLASTPGSGTTTTPGVVSLQLTQDVPEPPTTSLLALGLLAAALIRTTRPEPRFPAPAENAPGMRS